MDFRLPDLGENVTGGEIVKILVAEGDSVRKDQVVIELETDKALLEVPSPASGRVAKVHATAGRKIKVGEAILTIEESAEVASVPVAPAAAPPSSAPPPAAPSSSPPATPASGTGAPAAPSSAPAVAPAASAPTSASPSSAPSAPAPAPVPEAEVLEAPVRPPAAAAPSTRKLARELGVDLDEVQGTGGGGKITPEDVRDFVRSRVARPATGAAASPLGPVPVSGHAAAAAPPLPDFSKWGEIERVALSNVRKATMEQLSRSWALIPHVTQFDEADVTELEAVRRRHAQRAASKGGKLTATVFLLKAVVAALKEFPRFNASLDVEREELILKKHYHVGIAVDTEHGLVVPVIRDVDLKSVMDLSTELALVSERTRRRKVTLEDLRGGTFTISNLGGVGGTGFTPIINHPEVAILGVARNQKRLALRDGKVEERSILPLCLSYDHRIIDGADAVRFLRRVATMLEDPALLLLE